MYDSMIQYFFLENITKL